jgi:uncharacterized membrane protein
MRRGTLAERALPWVRLDFTGVAVAALFFCLSLTPSLLPRDWLNAGFIGGINAAIGYGIGVLAGAATRRLVLRGRRWWPPPPRIRYTLQAVVIAVSIGASVLMVVPAAAWQREVAELMGVEGPATVGYLRTLFVALLTGGAIVAAARLLIGTVRALARLMIRRWQLDDEVAMFIGTAIVVVVIVTLVNGVLLRGFLAGASAVFQPRNTTTRAGVEQPLNPERSGSPDSFAAWETLGFQGRNFVGTGPTAAELHRTQRPAGQGAHPHLRRTAVGPEHRGTGVGAALRAPANPRLRAQAAGDRHDDRDRVG